MKYFVSSWSMCQKMEMSFNLPSSASLQTDQCIRNIGCPRIASIKQYRKIYQECISDLYVPFHFSILECNTKLYIFSRMLCGHLQYWVCSVFFFFINFFIFFGQFVHSNELYQIPTIIPQLWCNTLFTFYVE